MFERAARQASPKTSTTHGLAEIASLVIGINCTDTVGYFPMGSAFASPQGGVVKDRDTPNNRKATACAAVQTSKEQDAAMRNYIDRKSLDDGGTYNLARNNNCAIFVQNTLRADGILMFPQSNSVWSFYRSVGRLLYKYRGKPREP